MPITLRCPTCTTQHTVADQLAGTKAKCRCGAVLTIPAQPAGVRTQAVTGKLPVQCASCGRTHQVNATLAGGAARCPCGQAIRIPNLQSVKQHMASLLDELNEDELHGTKKPKEDDAHGEKRLTDDEVLARYVKDPALRASPKKKSDRPGGVTTLGVLRLIATLGEIAALVMVAAFADRVSQAMESLGLSSPFLITALAFAVLIDGASAIGLLAGGQWGWWAATYSYVAAVLGNLLAMCNLHVLPGATEIAPGANQLELLQLLVRTLIIAALMAYLFSDRVTQFFQVTTHKGIALGIQAGAAVATVIVFVVLRYVL